MSTVYDIMAPTHCYHATVQYVRVQHTSDCEIVCLGRFNSHRKHTLMHTTRIHAHSETQWHVNGFSVCLQPQFIGIAIQIECGF